MPLVVDATFLCLAVLFAVTCVLASTAQEKHQKGAGAVLIIVAACCSIGMLAQYQYVY